MFWSEQYLIEHVTAVILGAALLVAASMAPRTGRALYAVLFAWACGVNWKTALGQPQVYLEYADLAVLEIYRDFIRGFFAQHIPAIVGTIATCQGVIAVGLVVGCVFARVALAGAMLFLLAIAPLGVGSGFPSTVLMALGCGKLLLTPAALAHSLPVQIARAVAARGRRAES